MFKQLIVLCAIATAVLCRHAPSNMNALYNEQISEKTMGSDDKGDDSFMANWDITSVYNSIKNYTNSDISVYLKMKLLSGIESATRNDMDLGSGIRLVRDNAKDSQDEQDDIDAATELRSLPRGLSDKEDALSSMIWKKINKLLRTHTMQVSNALHSIENKLRGFVNHIMRYELPAFILDVMEYKVNKFKQTQYKDKHKKKHKKKKKQKKKKKKKKQKKKKKKPQDAQEVIVHVHEDEPVEHEYDDSGHHGHHGQGGNDHEYEEDYFDNQHIYDYSYH